MYLLHNWKIEACNYACIKCWHVVKICLEHLSHSFCFSYKPFCFQVFLHYTQAFPVFAKICLFKISVHVCKRCCCEHSGAYTFLNYGLFYLVHCSDLNSKENQKGGDRYICVCEVRKTKREGIDIYVCVKSLSHVRLFATPWTVARQAPLSVGFSRQEYWSGLPFPSPMHASEKWK